MITLPTIREEIWIAEWQTLHRPGLRLTPNDRVLLSNLATGEDGEPGLTIEEVNGGVRIESRSWVGVVQLETFSVHIQPKLAGGNLRLVEMLQLTGGLKSLKRLGLPRTIQPESLNLFDLIALLLAEACATVVKAGLLSDYLVREDTLPVLRGRLLPDRQGIKHFGRVDRLECRYDEYQTDTPENQLLALTLQLCSQHVTNHTVRLQVKRLATIFQEVCDPVELNWKLLHSTLTYNRLNEHYRPAHELAWVVLERLGLQDILKLGKLGSFAFLLDMNLLFEQFIWKVLEFIALHQGLRVRYQLKNFTILWNPATNQPYSSIIPDFLIDAPGQNPPTGYLPVDAKYKLYDTKKVSNADLYQTFLYAFAYHPNPPQNQLPHALLLYPTSNKSPAPSTVAIRTITTATVGSIRILGLNIPALLDEIKVGKLGSSTILLSEQIKLTTTP